MMNEQTAASGLDQEFDFRERAATLPNLVSQGRFQGHTLRRAVYKAHHEPIEFGITYCVSVFPGTTEAELAHHLEITVHEMRRWLTRLRYAGRVVRLVAEDTPNRLVWRYYVPEALADIPDADQRRTRNHHRPLLTRG